MSNKRIDLTLEDEDGYNFENVLHGFDDIIGRLRVADDRIHGTAAWCDASGGAVPILERYPLLLAELKRCYEEIDEMNKNGNCNCKVWVVEEESRHGIDINVFKYRPDITDYIRKKETPTEDAEWEDKYYGEDVRIDYDGPDGWEYRVGNNDYCWKCSKS